MGMESSLAVDGSMTCSGGMQLVTAADGAFLSFDMVWKSCLDVVAG